jgi:hypothetical protein
MKRIITIGLLLLSVGASQAQALKELLEKAKANYPLLKAKRFESVAREDQVRYARSAAIPSIDAFF